MPNILKCKICGGDIELSNDKTLGTCMYCGSTMTFPKLASGSRLDAFNRGNHFRRIGEFDNALTIYEQMIADDNTDAEAHWCAALSRFGIEYVEDPASMEYIPTCHRTSYESFLDDVDYKAAVKYSEGITQKQYQKDGKKIDEVQKAILSTSLKESPFDVFICYKESDESGGRTIDSVLAQDIYDHLTEKGYKTFFSKITLEDKVGTEFEPYIFAALNSAKVMVVVGTSRENLDSVWVKNEWSRFLALMKKDKNKVLLPCYKDMDPYNMPEALSVLQSYNMASIGFMQDLIRGISKIVHAEAEHIVIENKTDVEPLLKRAGLFLETSEFDRVLEYCEKVLDIDPENATAYFYKLMATLEFSRESDFINNAVELEDIQNYQMAVRFADEAMREQLFYYNSCATKNRSYVNAVELLKKGDRNSLENALVIFNQINGWKDSVKQIETCNIKLTELDENKKKQEEKLQKERQILIRLTKIVGVILLCIFTISAIIHYVGPTIEVKKALKKVEVLIQEEEYDEALMILESIDTPDIEEKRKEILYSKAIKLMSEGEFKAAHDIFVKIFDYKDSQEKDKECKYNYIFKDIQELCDQDKYDEALQKLYEMDVNISENPEIILFFLYREGKYYLGNADYLKAADDLLVCTDANYEDSKELMRSFSYEAAIEYMKSGQLQTALKCLPYIDDSNKEKQYIEETCNKYGDLVGRWQCLDGTTTVTTSNNSEPEVESLNCDIEVRVKIFPGSDKVYYTIVPDDNSLFAEMNYQKTDNTLYCKESYATEGTSNEGEGVVDRDFECIFNYQTGELSIKEKDCYRANEFVMYREITASFQKVKE